MKPCRLIYRSVLNTDMLQSRPLSQLENQASNSNRRLGVCGILAISQGRILQVLEGTPKFVNQVYSKIVQDKRHHGVELIGYEGIVKPEFIDWSMKIINLDEVEPHLRELLISKYPVTDNQFHFQDDAFLMTSLLIDIKHILSNQNRDI